MWGRGNWERSRGPNDSDPGCLPPALTSCLLESPWHQQTLSITCPHQPHPTSEHGSSRWICKCWRLRALESPMETRSWRQPTGKAKQRKLLPAILFCCPGHEDSHLQPPPSALLCPVPAQNQPTVAARTQRRSPGFPAARPRRSVSAGTSPHAGDSHREFPGCHWHFWRFKGSKLAK